MPVYLQVLRWVKDWGKAKELAWQVAAAYAAGFKAIAEPQPGIREWLHALSKANVPCAIVTAFDRCSRGMLDIALFCGSRARALAWTPAQGHCLVMTCFSNILLPRKRRQVEAGSVTL